MRGWWNFDEVSEFVGNIVNRFNHIVVLGIPAHIWVEEKTKIFNGFGYSNMCTTEEGSGFVCVEVLSFIAKNDKIDFFFI